MIQRVKTENEDSEVDITPMLDVVFIMLIFFIVTASFVKEAGIGLNTPPPVSKEISTTAPITVKVTSDNKILVQGREVDRRSLRPTILRLRAEKPDAQITVIVEPSAQTRFIVQAVDGIRAANVELPTIRLARS